MHEAGRIEEDVDRARGDRGGDRGAVGHVQALHLAAGDAVQVALVDVGRDDTRAPSREGLPWRGRCPPRRR